MAFSLLPKLRAAPEDGAVSPRDLGALWREARALWRPRVSTMSDGTVYSVIEFATVKGTTLKAESEFHDTPEAALAEAIDRARAIRAAFK